MILQDKKSMMKNGNHYEPMFFDIMKNNTKEDQKLYEYGIVYSYLRLEAKREAWWTAAVRMLGLGLSINTIAKIVPDADKTWCQKLKKACANIFLSVKIKKDIYEKILECSMYEPIYNKDALYNRVTDNHANHALTEKEAELLYQCYRNSYEHTMTEIALTIKDHMNVADILIVTGLTLGEYGCLKKIADAGRNWVASQNKDVGVS